MFDMVERARNKFRDRGSRDLQVLGLSHTRSAVVYGAGEGQGLHIKLSRQPDPSQMPAPILSRSPFALYHPDVHSPMSTPPMFTYLPQYPWQNQQLHLFPANPYPILPPPPNIAHKVWILDCKSCGTFLTNRGMKVCVSPARRSMYLTCVLRRCFSCDRTSRSTRVMRSQSTARHTPPIPMHSARPRHAVLRLPSAPANASLRHCAVTDVAPRSAT